MLTFFQAKNVKNEGISISLSRVSFSSAQEKELLCNDGSPGGYYSRLQANSDFWIFHQQGGGWCFSEDSCTSRITKPLSQGDFGTLISSKNWPDTYDFQNGLFHTFKDANVVSSS